METWFDRRMAAVGAALLVLIGAYFTLRPSFAETRRIGESGSLVTGLTYELRSPLPRHLAVASARCPVRMSIGERSFSRDELPCSREGFVVFQGFLPAGTTVVEMSFGEPVERPKTAIRPPLSDPSLVLFLAAGIVLASMLFAGASGRLSPARWLAIILVVSALVRVSYVLHTPPWSREHDMSAHVQYIEYLREHHAIPHALEGWEFHQSPGYYALAALWSETRGLGRLQLQPGLLGLQPLSLLLSLATLPVLAWIAFLLFRRRSATAVLLFLLLAALNPATVFMASQISNDVLQALASFAFFALLLRWWESGSRRDWIILCIVISLGIVTKMSSLLFIPIAGTCLLLRETKIRVILRRVLEGGIVTGLLSGWLVFRRLFLENDLTRYTRSTGFEGYESMYVGTRLLDYLVFRPWFVLLTPYNHTRDDAFGRRYFWEFAYKSMLTGEWNFGPFVRPLAVLMMACGMGAILLGVAALLRRGAPRHPASLPVAVTLVILVAALAAYRLTGYSCNQDVRFIPLIVVPFAYYLVRGWEALAGTWSAVMLALILALGIAQGLFLLFL